MAGGVLCCSGSGEEVTSSVSSRISVSLIMRFSYDDATREFQICGIVWPMAFFESVANHGIWDGPCRIVRGQNGHMVFVRDVTDSGSAISHQQREMRTHLDSPVDLAATA